MITDEKKLEIEFEDKEESFADRATHLVLLNLTSDSKAHQHFTDHAKNVLRDHASFDTEDDFILTPTSVMSGYLHNFFGETNPLQIHKLVFSDIMLLALGYVDWREVADRFIRIAKESYNCGSR